MKYFILLLILLCSCHGKGRYMTIEVSTTQKLDTITAKVFGEPRISYGALWDEKFPTSTILYDASVGNVIRFSVLQDSVQIHK